MIWRGIYKQMLINRVVGRSGTLKDKRTKRQNHFKFATKSDPKGTSLGLFISKSIVEAHGGRICAENNPNGRGATFGFSLPIYN
jgi:signal transduction histidine kinase